MDPIDLRRATNVLGVEFSEIIGTDPDSFFVEAFESVAQEKPDLTRRTIDGRDVEELRKKWGTGSDAKEGLAAATAIMGQVQ